MKNALCARAVGADEAAARSRRGGANVRAVVWRERDKKIIAYLRGLTKTNGSATNTHRERGRVRERERASAVLTVYLTYDVNVSAAVIV